MRTSEWIQAGFATILDVAAWIFPLTVRRRLTITLLAACAIAAVALARLSEYILSPVQASILRDWLPVPLTLIPYWQTGQFFVGPNEKIQAWLVETDRWLLSLVSRTKWTFGRFARLTMEWAYLLLLSAGDTGAGDALLGRIAPACRHILVPGPCANLPLLRHYTLCTRAAAA